jgi:tellurite resistance protein
MQASNIPVSTGFQVPRVPASFFGMVLGIAGLGNSWRAAASVWGLPAAPGEALSFLAVAVWLVVSILYGLKWLTARAEALAELEHAVQCCFIGLAGVATMLAGLALLPYSRLLTEILFAAGAIFTFVFALWRTGRLWQGGRDPATTTPVLYLPTVAGSFVTAILAGALGYHEFGQLAFGAGFFSWLAIESVLLHRLLTAPEFAVQLRPTLGIQLAPPAVGSVAYLSASGAAPDMLVHSMLGYAILEAALLLRLLPWIMKQPFAGSYWAFTFGATALATAAIRVAGHSGDAGFQGLAAAIFVIVNIVMALIAAGTVWLLLKGKLLPAPAPKAS